MIQKLQKIKKKILSCLTEDLVLPKFRGTNPLRGQCYVASEALYHLAGGKEAGFKAMYLKHDGQSHWYLQFHDKVIDITVGQFQNVPNYELGRAIGFLTSNPSKRAKILIERVKLA